MGRPRKNADPTQLSVKQAAVLDYIRAYVAEHSYPPSVRDICAAVGLKSTSSVFSYINDLEKMGFLKKDPAHPRAIKLLGAPTDSKMQRELAQVPLVGEVAAGQPLLAEENIVDYYPLPVDALPNQEIFMLKVKGDSMINAGIFDGDQVIVAKQSHADDGEVVVALLNDSATVKRFYKEPDRIRLQPENDAMAPIFAQDCMILGKVIGLLRFGVN